MSFIQSLLAPVYAVQNIFCRAKIDLYSQFGTKSAFESLPPELLAHIFKQIEEAATQDALIRSCKTINYRLPRFCLDKRSLLHRRLISLLALPSSRPLEQFLKLFGPDPYRKVALHLHFEPTFTSEEPRDRK